jgi:S1-C subfamily serine protease
MRIPALGIMVFSGRNGGAEITEIGARSVAESAGIHVGDVINAVDGKPVKTPTELAAAFSGIAPGSKVRIGYMVRGQWQTETVVILGGS